MVDNEKENNAGSKGSGLKIEHRNPHVLSLPVSGCSCPPTTPVGTSQHDSVPVLFFLVLYLFIRHILVFSSSFSSYQSKPRRSCPLFRPPAICTLKRHQDLIHPRSLRLWPSPRPSYHAGKAHQRPYPCQARQLVST